MCIQITDLKVAMSSDFPLHSREFFKGRTTVEWSKTAIFVLPVAVFSKHLDKATTIMLLCRLVTLNDL